MDKETMKSMVKRMSQTISQFKSDTSNAMNTHTSGFSQLP